MTEVHVFIRSVYGVMKVYPANDAAQALAEIAGTKTLSTDALANATRLGCQVQVVADPRAALPN